MALLPRSTAAMTFSGCPRTGPSVTQKTHFHVLPSGSGRLPSALSSTGSSRSHFKISPCKKIGSSSYSSSSRLQANHLRLSTCLQQRERDIVLKERARISISGAIANSSDKEKGSHSAKDLSNCSRRLLIQSGATLASLAIWNLLSTRAEALETNAQASPTKPLPLSEDLSGADSSATAAASKPKKPIVDTGSWYRFRGEGFAMKVPPEFEDVVEYDDSGNSLYGERAKEKPFAARFASPDRKEVLSVVVRNASQMKLSFFETQDISDLGSLEEAARMFVPAGSKVIAARSFKPDNSRVSRTYYLYEFLAKDKRVAMSAAAAGGRVYVFGAMAPNSKWKQVGNTMRSAALNFALL